jgi:anthranilate phosphoribosyltransferase
MNSFLRRAPIRPTKLQGRITSADDIPTRAGMIWAALDIKRDDGPEMVGHIAAMLEAYAECDRAAGRGK